MSKSSETNQVYWIRVGLKGAPMSTSQRARHILQDVRRSSGAEDVQMITSGEMAKLIAGAIRSVCAEQDGNGGAE